MKFFFIILAMALTGQLHGQTYENTDAIFKNFLNSSVYNTEVIPISNQSLPIEVLVDFSLVSIVGVDDTTESFVCNGFLTLTWTDERLKWDPTDYGGKTIIHPLPKQIWRPRVILLNTLDDRDLFADDVSPVLVSNTGAASWVPGSLFTTSCSLNLLKYPFDEQLCSIQMLSMGLPSFELEFVAGSSELDFYSINGEWDLKDLNVVVSPRSTSGVNLSSFDVNIRMKRRPTFYVLNIILPFVFLSLLNLLVFTIPQESGEKVGYGITVLLALSVFFSIIGGMLPRSSETVPYVIIYLFILYVISTLAVIDSIVIGFIYHMEEREEYHRKMRNKFKNIVGKMSKTKNVVDTMKMKPVVDPSADEPTNEDGQKNEKLASEIMKRLTSRDKMGSGEESESEKAEKAKLLKHKLTASILDFFSGLVFILAWITVTLWYFISVVS